MRHDFRLDTLDIFRMNAVEPLVGPVLEFLLAVTQHRLPARAELHLVGFKVPFPKAVACSSQQHRTTFLARGERLESFVSLCYSLFKLEALKSEFEPAHDCVRQQTERPGLSYAKLPGFVIKH